MLDYGRSATYMIPESFQQLIIHTPFFLFVRSYDYASPLSVFWFLVLNWIGLGLLVLSSAILSAYCYYF